jgi:hypothetical protein
MISALDSFLSYLNTELAGNPPVNWQRADPNDADANVLKENHLNVSILAVEQEGSSEEILISLDLVGYSEREVFGWAKRVRDVLLQQQFTPEFDHEVNPSSPVALQRSVSWKRDEVRFTVVESAHRFVQLNATFPICHTRF